jgi:hypothetical protein
MRRLAITATRLEKLSRNIDVTVEQGNLLGQSRLLCHSLKGASAAICADIARLEEREQVGSSRSKCRMLLLP